MNTKKVKKFLLDYFNFKNVNEKMDASGQIDVVQQLEREGLISFSFEERSSDCDYWITAETGVTIELDCKRYVGIVFDYNVKLYDSETIKEFIATIEKYEKIALKIIDKFKTRNLSLLELAYEFGRQTKQDNTISIAEQRHKDIEKILKIKNDEIPEDDIDEFVKKICYY